MSAAPEIVLLLHGMGRRASSFSRLQQFLEQAGYRASAWSYPSTRTPFQEQGVLLQRELAALDADGGVARVHLVGHSLGGIVARHALTLGVPRKLGRLVMLAPPNRGSRVARFLAPLLRGWIKPMSQLSDAPDSDVNRLPPPAGIEIGVIAAARDGKVRVEDTHIDGEADHLVVPGFHSFIMNRPDVHEAVFRFLRVGRFGPEV